MGAMDEVLRTVRLAAAGMWRYRMLGLLVAWGVGALALAGIMLLPSKYEASARIFVNTESILKPLMTGLTVQPNDDQRIVMLSRVVISRPNVERIVRKAGLDADVKPGEQRERLIDTVMKTLEFRGGGRESIYTLSFRDVDAARAKVVVQMLADLFIQSSHGGKTQDTETAKRFIDDQIAVYDRKLQDAENRLKDFRLRYLGLSPGDGRDYFMRMAETSKLLDQARLELREAERSRDAYRQGLAHEEMAQPAAAPAHAPDTSLAEIDARLDTMRRSLDALLQRFTEEHPDVVGAKRVIRELEQQRRAALAVQPRPAAEAPVVPTAVGPRAADSLKVSLAQAEASVAALAMRTAEYTERYNRLKASAALLPQLEAEHAQLNRDYDVNKKNYETLVARREAASISGEMQSIAGVSDFRVVDPPRVSPLPVSPNRRLLLPLALVLALLAGLAAMYAAHEFHPAFQDSRSLREATQLPVVGTVAALEDDGARRRFRASVWRFGAAASSLAASYAVAFMAVEMLTVQHV